MGVSLHADAYHASSDEAQHITELASAPMHCPCGLPNDADSSDEQLPVAEAQPAPPPQPLHYVVNRGDTLSKIARDFDVSVAALMMENNISNANVLTVGQRLIVPDADAAIVLPDGQFKSIERVLSSTLTAYTAGVESTGKTPESPQYGITFSGSKAEEGRTIAVDPDIIPLGTKVYIDGIGVRTAEDTGSAVKGARIDVFMNDVGEAINFGVKPNVKVYVLSTESI
ncbi:LysM peptidoglycan-binding domain-containing protein [Paenibacillus xerothermodurans]|uniref:LysM peptidoglycan-binding domain-containing protein n=2 Tax=Paenibacillus xerothermodurans TaxID=1977292 RepID=A0A2W1N8I1_PAEXE|nr:LysM peptidoglycan-binding domain-containing protein [Paenibacillus xerothermodurans]